MAKYNKLLIGLLIAIPIVLLVCYARNREFFTNGYSVISGLSMYSNPNPTPGPQLTLYGTSAPPICNDEHDPYYDEKTQFCEKAGTVMF